MAAEDIFTYWKPVTGNDLLSGDTWDDARLTYAALEALLGGGRGNLMINLAENEIMGENITPTNWIHPYIIGNARFGHMHYILSGAADANPMINISGDYKSMSLHRVTLLSTELNKSFIRISNAWGSFGLEISNFCQIFPRAAGQIGIKIDSCLTGGVVSNVLFWALGAGPWTGTYYIQNNKIGPSAPPILFRNCIFIFVDTGVIGGIEEPQIYNLGAGANQTCKFYNCCWVRINADTTFTILTNRNTYPSTASAINRDPEPIRTIDWDKILPQLRLAVRDVESGGYLVSSGADDRDATEIYNLIGSIASGPQVSIEVPEKLIRPVAGSTAYRININVYDSAGNPEAPDVAPTIKIMTRDEATTRVVETNMTQVVGQTGQYYYDYTITSATTLEKESIIIKLIEGGVTTYHREVTEIYEEGTSGSGSGSVVVDHDYGGVDNYRILRLGTGAAVEGANIYFFTQADWNAGNRDLRSVHDGGNCRGQSTTGSDGRWLTPVALDPDTYIMFISDPEGEYLDNPVTVVVT